MGESTGLHGQDSFHMKMRCVGLFLSVMLEAQRSKCCNLSHLIPHRSLCKAWWEGDWRGMGPQSTQCTVCVRACVRVRCSAVWSCDCNGSAPHVSSVWVIQRVQDFLLMCSYLYARTHVLIRCTVHTQLITVTQNVVCLLLDIHDAWYRWKTNRLQSRDFERQKMAIDPLYLPFW